MNTKFMMQSTYDAIQNLPIVKFLLEENEKLKKENGALKNLIYSLPEFRSKKSSKKSRVNLYSAERKKEYVRGGDGNSNVLYPEYIKANVVNPIKEEKIPIKKEKKVTIKREIINVDEMNANPSDIVVKEEEVTFVQNIICVEDESETEIVDLNLNNSKQLPKHNNKAKEEEAEQDIENTRVKKTEDILEIVQHQGEEKQKTEKLEVKKTEETTSIVKEDDDDDTEEEKEEQEQETVKVEVEKTEEITLAVKEQDEEANEEVENAKEDEDTEEEDAEEAEEEEDEDVEEQEDSTNVEVKKTVEMTSAVKEVNEEAEEEEDEQEEEVNEEAEEEEEEEEEEVNGEAEEEEAEEEEDRTNVEVKKTVEMISTVKEEQEEAEEEEEEECFEIEIDGVSYYTNNETNGKIYNIGADEDDIGDEVGYFKDKKPHFTNK